MLTKHNLKNLRRRNYLYPRINIVRNKIKKINNESEIIFFFAFFFDPVTINKITERKGFGHTMGTLPICMH